MSLVYASGLALPSMSWLCHQGPCSTVRVLVGWVLSFPGPFTLLSVNQRSSVDTFQRAPALTAVTKLAWQREHQWEKCSYGGKGYGSEGYIPGGRSSWKLMRFITQKFGFVLCTLRLKQQALKYAPTQILGLVSFMYLCVYICPHVHTSQSMQRWGDTSHKLVFFFHTWDHELKCQPLRLGFRTLLAKQTQEYRNWENAISFRQLGGKTWNGLPAEVLSFS